MMISLVVILISNLLVGLPVAAAGDISLPSGFEAKEILSGLSNPTDIAFSSDGRWFIAERAGKIRVVEDGKLLKEPLLDITDHVSAFQDGGLLTVALDLTFRQMDIFTYCTLIEIPAPRCQTRRRIGLRESSRTL